MDSKKVAHSPFEVELFSTKKQWAIFLSVCILVFLWNLFQEYRHYIDFTSPNDTQEVYVQVIAQYSKEKNGLFYETLKLKDRQGAIFYTNTKESLKDLSHRFLRIYGKRLNCSFIEYLQRCFFISYYISVLAEVDYRDTLRHWIDKQHKESLISALYKTLIMADFLPQVWRDLSNKLGIAHLIAISGFHLGVLGFVIGGLLSLVYSVFHVFVSYRNKYYDIGFCVLICLFIYLLVLDFSPSFLRAFVMAVFGYFVIYRGIKLISFRFLFVVVCVCLALFPRLIFNIGFVLSVGGVFFVYLFISHMRSYKGFVGKFIYMPFVFNGFIFIDMLPIAHWFFPYFTPWCLLSIPLSLLFVIFFPFMLIAHIVGFGFIGDDFLQWVMHIDLQAIEFYTPWWFIALFGICAIAAIYAKGFYYALHVLGGGFYVWCFKVYMA